MLPSSIFLSSKPVFRSLCLSVLKAPIKKGGSKSWEEKTEHSDVRGLWTSQMHSERPLIKNNQHRRWAEKTGAGLADVKSNFCYLIYHRLGQEIHQSFCQNTKLLQQASLFWKDTYTHKYTQSSSSARGGRRGPEGSLVREEDQISTIHLGQNDQREPGGGGYIGGWLCAMLV